MHGHKDVSAANEFVGDVELGDRLPVAVLLDACLKNVSALAFSRESFMVVPRTLPEVLILQHVEGSELLGVDALEAEDLDGGARETTLRRLGRTLHEEDDGRGSDGLVDRGANLGGQEGPLKSGEARGEERVAARAEGLGSDLRDCQLPEELGALEWRHTEKAVLENMLAVVVLFGVMVSGSMEVW